MSENTVLVVFTAKSVERILKEGGTSSWRLDRNNARQCEFAVCTRNAHADWVEGPEDHHSAFLVGRITDVVPCPNHENRYLVQFSEYALMDVPEIWKGDRNPLKYAVSLESLGIDHSQLKWEKMPEEGKKKGSSRPQETASPLTIAEAKKGLALTFGVAPTAIEITIRG